VDEQGRRDDVIERELSRALRARAAAPAAGPHLDADTAAAWIERRLDPQAAQSTEAHLASCADCQAMVATLARITPEPEPAAGSWWSVVRRPWLVPATAAAALALVIWVSQAQRPAPSTQAVTTQARVQEVEPAGPEAQQSLEFAAPSVGQAAADGPTPERQRTEQLQKRIAGRDQPDAAASRSARGEPTAPAPAAIPAAAAVADRADAEAKVAATPQVGDLRALEGAAAARATPPAAPAAERQEAERQEAAANAAPRALSESARFSALQRAVELHVIAADGTGRWRRAGTTLEFAAGPNAPFAAATLPFDASMLAAGASPGGRVCWLVGRSGAVLVTTDGTRFSRVSAPAPVDFVSVSATDARNATVAAADGRRFRTTDQGATWTVLDR